MRFPEWPRGRNHEDRITLAIWVVMGAILAGPLLAGTVSALAPPSSPERPVSSAQLRPRLPAVPDTEPPSETARPFDTELPDEPDEVYKDAQRKLAAEHPACGLRWELLAAIGQVEPRRADSALATGRLLCAGDRDLTDSGQLERALLAYNPSREYVRTVRSWYEHFVEQAEEDTAEDPTWPAEEDPLAPLEPLEPLETTESMEPLEPLEPTEPLEPSATTGVPAEPGFSPAAGPPRPRRPAPR